MSGSAAELAHRLAREAEAVCRHYLSNGRRQGRYWLVGDVQNTPGRSLFVRLTGPDAGRGAAGHWLDAATGQHGDLLDLIRLNRGLDRLGEALGEARTFLGLPKPELPRAPARAGSSDAARRLFALSRPIVGTLAETYLRNRGITARLEVVPALRFHPGCFYRAHDAAPRESWPALIAAVTDAADAITGVHRTWLDRDGAGKAPIATPRRALGHLLGNAVRFGTAPDAKRSASSGVSWARSRANRASAPKRRRSALKSFVTGQRIRASIPAALARSRRRIAASRPAASLSRAI